MHDRLLKMGKAAGSVAIIIGTLTALVATSSPDDCGLNAEDRRFVASPGCGPGGVIVVRARTMGGEKTDLVTIDDPRPLGLTGIFYGMVPGCPRDFARPGWTVNGSREAAKPGDGGVEVDGSVRQTVKCTAAASSPPSDALVFTCVGPDSAAVCASTLTLLP